MSQNQVGSIFVTVNSNAQTVIPKQIQQALNTAQRYLNSKPLDLKVDTRGLNNLHKLNNLPLGKISEDASEFRKSIEAATARVVAFGAAAGSIYVITRALKDLVSTTIEVEKGFQEIKAIFDITDKNFKRFSNDLFNVSRVTASSIKEVSSAAMEFARQGTTLDKTLENTRNALTLTKISGLELNKSIQVLIGAYNQFGSEVRNTTQVVDKLTNVDTKYAVSAKDLAEAISRAGSTAIDAKVSLNELLGTVTALQQTTQRGGSIIGNSLKSIFTRIQRSDNIKLLESLGVATKTAEGNFRGALPILKDFAQVYKTLSDAQQAYISEQLAGVYQINQFKALIKDLGSTYSITEQATLDAATSQGTAAKRLEEINKSTAAQLQILKSSISQAVSEFGNLSISPFLKDGINLANLGIQNFGKALADYGTDNEDTGSRIAAGIVKGIGNFLTGPGLVIVASAFTRLFGAVSKYALNIGKEMLSLNSVVKQQANLNAEINNLLANGNQHYAKRLLAAKSIREQEEIIATLQRQNTTRNFASPIGIVATQLRNKGFYSRGDGIKSKHIPNFADPIESAIRREQKITGLPLSNIKVGYDPRIGIGVYNTKDEPHGLSQGVNRAIAEGKDPKKYGIPNFAASNTIDIDGITVNAQLAKKLFESFGLRRRPIAPGTGGRPEPYVKTIEKLYEQLGDFPKRVLESQLKALSQGQKVAKIFIKNFDKLAKDSAKNINSIKPTLKKIEIDTTAGISLVARSPKDVLNAINRELEKIKRRDADIIDKQTLQENKYTQELNNTLKSKGIYASLDELKTLDPQGLILQEAEKETRKRLNFQSYTSSVLDNLKASSTGKRIERRLYEGGRLSSKERDFILESNRVSALESLGLTQEQYQELQQNAHDRKASRILRIISGRSQRGLRDIESQIADVNFSKALEKVQGTNKLGRGFGFLRFGIGKDIEKIVAQELKKTDPNFQLKNLPIEKQIALRGIIESRRAERQARLDQASILGSFALSATSGLISSGTFKGLGLDPREQGTGGAISRAAATSLDLGGIGLTLSTLARGGKSKAALAGLPFILGAGYSLYNEKNFNKETDRERVLQSLQNKNEQIELARQYINELAKKEDLIQTGAPQLRLAEQSRYIDSIRNQITDSKIIEAINTSLSLPKIKQQIESFGESLSKISEENRLTEANTLIKDFFSDPNKIKNVKPGFLQKIPGFNFNLPSGIKDEIGLQNILVGSPLNTSPNKTNLDSFIQQSDKLSEVLKNVDTATQQDVAKAQEILEKEIPNIYEKTIGKTLQESIKQFTDPRVLSKVLEYVADAAVKARYQEPAKLADPRLVAGNLSARFGGIEGFLSGKYDTTFLNSGFGAQINFSRFNKNFNNIRSVVGNAQARNQLIEQTVLAGQGQANLIQQLKDSGAFSDDQIKTIVGNNVVNKGIEAFQMKNFQGLATSALNSFPNLQSFAPYQFYNAQQFVNKGDFAGARTALGKLQFNNPDRQEEFRQLNAILEALEKNVSSIPDSAIEQSLTLLQGIKDEISKSNDILLGADDVDSSHAHGFIPNLAKEKLNISKGVGGARSYDQPYLANTTLGRIALNTGEKMIPNFMGSGKPAILNRRMIPNFADNSNGVLNTAGGILGGSILSKLFNKKALGFLLRRGTAPVAAFTTSSWVTQKLGEEIAPDIFTKEESGLKGLQTLAKRISDSYQLGGVGGIAKDILTGIRPTGSDGRITTNEDRDFVKMVEHIYPPVVTESILKARRKAAEIRKRKKPKEIPTTNVAASTPPTGKINSIFYTPHGAVISSSGSVSSSKLDELTKKVSIEDIDKRQAELRNKNYIYRAFNNEKGKAVDFINNRVVDVNSGFIGTLEEYEKFKKSSIPNFANQISDAKKREINALKQNYGLSEGEARRMVYVGFDPRIGLGVANTIDEPKGLYQGVNRVLKQGMNPIKYKGGQVGNYATPTNSDRNDQQIKSLQDIISILQNFLNILQDMARNNANRDTNNSASPTTENIANITINATSSNGGDIEKLISSLQNSIQSLNYKIEQIAKKTNTVFIPTSFATNSVKI